jgi:flavin reductase (DIM6/NTAB) family NADH-FMN oxidoreductase RutF
MRREFDPAETDPGLLALTLKAIIVPRPIAWVSTVSADGVANLAPHSFFTVASEVPAIVQFTSIGSKDTLTNVEATGEFVVCLAGRDQVVEVNGTGTDYPPETSEFDAMGIETEPSSRVEPPRVRRSPAAIECRLERIVSFGQASVVFGRVEMIVVAEAVLDGEHPDVRLLDPVARLGRNEWSTLGDVLEIDRIPYRPVSPPE